MESKRTCLASAMMLRRLIGPFRPPVEACRAEQARLVIELAGPAGSGKTTLRKLLCERDQHLVEMSTPTKFECLRQLPKLATSVFPWSADRWFTWDELRSQLYVQAWLKSLPRLTGDRLFDQGPVFRLAVLDEFGPRAVPESGLMQWRRWLLDAWSRSLSLVVWLDAPNEELLRRIRNRQKTHKCELLSDCDAHALLDRYRDAHNAVLAAMEARGKPPAVILVNTDTLAPEEIVLAVQDELKQLRSSRAPPRSSLSVSSQIEKRTSLP